MTNMWISHHVIILNQYIVLKQYTLMFICSSVELANVHLATVKGIIRSDSNSCFMLSIAVGRYENVKFGEK